MKRHLKIAYLSALGLCFAPGANTQSLSGPTALSSIASTPYIAIQCAGDCWRPWRNHYRWGSYGGGYWHNRWRSHFRWSSYGGYGHSRWGSHYRIGSYHRYWGPNRSYGYDD
jgi:hypothetical protein